MSFRTNPDRILDNIDRERSRDDEAGTALARDASSRELDTEVPDPDQTTSERVRRIFRLIEQAYTSTASGAEMRRLAQRFQTVGDISGHHARGDVSVLVSYLDHERPDDIGLIPFEIHPERLIEARKATKSTRPDANALRVLREELRSGVMEAYRKMEPRLRDAVRDRADLGHVAAQVTLDLRAGG